MLELSVERDLGGFRIAASFEAGEGVTALFGRSGAGKSSIVQMIGGLVRPDRGRIAVDGRVLYDSERRIAVPPHKRRVGYVFQDDRLFPHLTVRQNLVYGRWFARKGERYADFDQIVALLGIEDLLGRRPARLSGGERQRVSIGRALLASPKILLMDEPLAALDDARKAEIIPYIERLRDEMHLPIVYVSHSVAEVTRLGTTLVLLSNGRVAAAGPVAELMSRTDLFPLTGRFEAGAVVETTIDDHDDASGLTRLGTRAGPLLAPRIEAPIGTPLRVRIRSRDVVVATEHPKGLSALNILPATVADVRSDGRFADVTLDANGETLLARITDYSVGALGLEPGRPVFAVIKSITFDQRSLGLPRVEVE